ncbi:hypothetical protein DKB71_25115 [Pseudomonas sp. PLMAX]
MPATTPKAAPAAVPLTHAERLEALVEHTGDLDKAEALQASIPPWLATADLPVVQALNAAFEQSFPAQGKVATALEQLKPLNEFCKEQLTDLLKEKWAIEVDVERDTLEIEKKTCEAMGLAPFCRLIEEKTISRSLLQAAMENFTFGEATSGGVLKGAVIRIDAKAQSGTEVTAEKFATLCRELDLGARYQRHITEALALPAKPADGAPIDDRAGTADIRRLKVLDMQVALHMAYLKKDITPAVYKMLLTVLEQDVPAAQTKGALLDGAPVRWQGLRIHDACICGVLVFSKVSIETDAKARCVVYMPNEPRRPLFEYASREEFESYLTLHLQSKSYRKFFGGQYLHGHDRIGFFTGFDKDKNLGTLTATPADTCLADFFFSSFVSKIEEDTRILAVPTEDVDAQQREKTYQVLEGAGLVLLTAFSFFVPVIGHLMLAAAAVDIVSEVFEGVQDWTHGERKQALSHLLNVVENLGQMAAFAAGGKVITSAVKGVKEQVAFFDGFEAVTRTDGKPRLWKPDLEPYKRTTTLPADVQADSQGLYRHAGQTSIVMDGAPYGVTRNAGDSAWIINHPARTDAYQPAALHNVHGGWRHVHEHAHEWRDGAYALERTDQHLSDLGSDLEAIAEITDITPENVHPLHESNLKLPQRLYDCVQRFRIERRITRLVAAMARGEIANTDFIQEQLHTLPRLPGWPKERFIEVRNEQGGVLSRFPETAPQDDDVNSVQVSQKQLDSGQLLDTVIKGLYPNEVENIVGKASTESDSHLLAKKIAISLEGDRQSLFEWLYTTWDGSATDDVATLREHAADLPVRVGQELLENASGRDRSFLADRKIAGVDLARQVREAQAMIRQDRALTGLHLPPLANADTDKLALGLMNRVQGWNGDVRLEVRQGSTTGTLLDSVGKAEAKSCGVIVKIPTGYQVIQGTGNVVSTLTSETLLESILDALPASQRSAMGLTGSDTLDVPTLRSRLSRAATADPAHTGRLLRGERNETPEHLSACVQADPPAASAYARGMIRKVKKLYPLFTEIQVLAFLDAAGSTQMQRGNRIRVLEQQLKKLRQVLRDWRDDEMQMKSLGGQLDVIRVNRRQVAMTIENCWRRITPAGWPPHDPFTSLTLIRNPVGPLPTLTEDDVAHVRSLSIMDMQAGDELEYFLKPFKGLVSLELDRNRLTRLPEVLSHMPNLQHLRLDGNGIALTEHTLRKLADMRTLRTLGLSGNRLGATIDVSKMLDLRDLFLRDTHATELPVGLNRLPYLNFLDLRGNQIMELPAWLFQVPRRFAEAINLRDNPISETSRTLLETYRNNRGVGMGLLDDKAVVISEQRARDLWLPENSEETYTRRNRQWLALTNEPGANGFFELLAELGGSADNRFVHEDMTRRVWSVIDAIQTDSALRDQLLAMAVRANCADAAATIFSNLEVAVNIDTVARQSANAHDRAARLLSLGRRLFRLDYLTRLAREHARPHPDLEPLEVELAYRTGLADRLDIFGQPRHMRYASNSGVTAKDLETAYSKVITAETSPELSTYIQGRTFWSDFLRQHHGKDFTDVAAPFQEQMQAAIDSEKEFGADYLATVDGIVANMKTEESKLLKRLTEAAMKAVESETCFALD